MKSIRIDYLSPRQIVRHTSAGLLSASGFRPDIVMVPELYFTDTPAVISASSDTHKPFPSRGYRHSSNDYHELFPEFSPQRARLQVELITLRFSSLWEIRFSKKCGPQAQFF
jgi:hypothetical protein